MGNMTDFQSFLFDLILLAYMALPMVVLQLFATGRFVHMFQLNSYKSDRYFDWMNKNVRAIINPFGVVLGIVLFDWLRRNTEGQHYFSYFVLPFVLFGGAVYFVTKLAFGKKKKKPLVFTGRVQRLYVTIVLVAIVLGLLAISLCMGLDLLLFSQEGGFRPICAFAIMYFFCLFPISAFLPVIADWVNRPMEKAINRKYTKKAMAKLESAKNLITVGVTGSYGKTSTKFIVKEMLMEKYQTLMTPESFNTPLGVVRALNSGLNAMTEVFVCEMGAKAKGDIQEICDMVHPKYGIITAVGVAHLENFKSLDLTRSTKFELAYALPEDGMAFLNMDSAELAKENYSRPHRTYGLQEGKDYDFTAKNISYSVEGTSFTLCTKAGEETEIITKLLGRHNVLNIVGAAACAVELGVTLSEVKAAVARLKPVTHRLELTVDKGDHLIIDDAFNSNPEGAEEALNVLASFTDRKRIVITPGMIELGEAEYEANKKLGRHAASCCDLLIGVGEKRSEAILAGAAEGGMAKENTYAAKNLKEALAIMRGLVDGPSVLLLENDLPDNYEKV